MITYLKGDFVFKSPSLVVVDISGVGYEVQISLNTYSKIQNLDKGILYTSLLIREDAHILFGFAEKAEKEMFLQLINVSGVGAATARIMLSYLKPDELAKAIISENTAVLESIKGIGKKTAERIVLELKDKLSKHGSELNISALKHNTLYTDALNALMALGLSRNNAEAAIQKAQKSNPSNASLEHLIKCALKMI